MSFLYPGYFWLGLILLAMMLQRRRKKEADMDRGTQAKLVFVYLSLLMIIISLSRPVIDHGPVDQEYEGAEVVIALDLSYSMQAEDIAPNRLEASKQLIKELISTRVHERFALLGFTTNAIILSPLSSDAELLSHQLDLIRSDLVVTKGTRVASVLELATKLSQVKSKNLIIVGDGGDEKDFSKEIAYAKKHGLSISVIMMATSSGARLKDRQGEWMKDSEEHLVISSKNSRVKSLCEATGGVYAEADNALETISDWLQSREKKLSGTKIFMYQELFYYPTALALLFFMLGVTKLQRYAAKAFFTLLLLVGINAEASLNEFSAKNTQDEAYAEKKSLEELERFKKRAGRSPEDHYNLGNAHYRAGQYEEAITVYKEIRSSDAGLKAKLFHNLGNAYVRMEMFDEARAAYKKSLIIAYDKETDENLLHISDLNKHEGMMTGQQEGEKRNESVSSKDAPPKEAQQKKEAGGSNMKVSAEAGAGAQSKGKKVQSEAQVSFNAAQSALSFRQYELINERSVHEENPW